MALHARHVRTLPGAIDVQVKFERRDLLYKHRKPLRNPHAKNERVVERLPIETERGRLVGPTLLDMLVRRRWEFRDLPKETQAAVLQQRAPNERAPHAVMAWSVRELDTLWPRPGQLQREPRKDEVIDREQRELHHPFLARLASGGWPGAGSVGEWVAVHKLSTCQISEHVFRVACGVFGGVDQAHDRVAEAAAEAWNADLERALKLWECVRGAPGGVLVEDEKVAELRPLCSISREVERAVLREVCEWLGVDPELSVTRPRGRPKSADKNAAEGKVVRVELRPDGSVTGSFVVDYEAVAKGTEFHRLELRELVMVLGALRTQQLEKDCALLEAWLDAAMPDWRERATAADHGTKADSAAPDPYEVLGVERSATMGAVTAAYRRALNAVHPDKSGASAWLVRMVVEAYKQIRAARATHKEDPA